MSFGFPACILYSVLISVSPECLIIDYVSFLQLELGGSFHPSHWMDRLVILNSMLKRVVILFVFLLFVSCKVPRGIANAPPPKQQGSHFFS